MTTIRLVDGNQTIGVISIASALPDADVAAVKEVLVRALVRMGHAVDVQVGERRVNGLISGRPRFTPKDGEYCPTAEVLALCESTGTMLSQQRFDDIVNHVVAMQQLGKPLV